jgi:catechol 2,3-dioxygenase-like lactoylglutathione lyase family enzyme
MSASTRNSAKKQQQQQAFVSTRDVLIQTPDIAAAAAFYSFTLGLPITTQSDSLVGFDTGAFQLFLDAGETLPAPVFEFYVRDVKEAKDRLLAAGCTVQAEDASVPRCYIRDPYGLIFNLAKRP